MMKISTLFLAAISFSWLFCTTACAEDRPNIIIMLADDAGWGDYSYTGNPDIKTPHIDSLAAEGVSLERYFVEPACAPTRAALLTGRYPLRSGVAGVSSGNERLNAEELTLPEALRAAGYATGMFGKWHNGAQWPYVPTAHGFERVRAFMHGQPVVYFDETLLNENGLEIRTEGYIDDVVTNEAIQFIRESSSTPFFCYVAFALPHKPWIIKDEYWDRWKDREISLTGKRPRQHSMDGTRAAMAMMETQDDHVGQILKTLEDLNLENDTIVIYFSDNGPNEWRWNGDMRGIKGWSEEGGTRSACFVRYPEKFPAGLKVERITGVIDWLPTLADLSGINLNPPKPLDGKDITPLLEGHEAAWQDRRIFSWWSRGPTVRTETYRMSPDGELYDMVADPHQEKDISADYPKIASDLQRVMDALLAEMPVLQPDFTKPFFQIGFPEFPITRLAASEAIGRGGIPRSGAAPNNSWLMWNAPSGDIYWPAEVMTSGRYRVEIDYTCPPGDVGSLIRVSFNGSSLEKRLEEAYDPDFSDNDTVPRAKRMTRTKPFKRWDMGTIDLTAGKGTLRLKASEVPRDKVMDFRRMILTLLTES